MSAGKTVFITALVLIPLVGVGVGIGVFYALKSRQVHVFLVNLAQLEDQFIRTVNLEVEAYAYLNRITINYHDRFNISRHPPNRWIDFMDLGSIRLYEANNEVKFIPVLWTTEERASFISLARQFLTPDFEVVDLVVGGSPPTFSAAPIDRFPLCPLSYLAPNTTEGLIPFLGVDLCNSSQWTGLIGKLFNSPNQTAIGSRLVLRTNRWVLDIGLNYYDEDGVIRAISVSSYLFSDLVDQNLRGLFGPDVEEDVVVTLTPEGSETMLYTSGEVFDTPYRSVKSTRFLDQDIVYTVSFLYRPQLVDAFEAENRATLLAVIVVVFVIMDAVLVLSVMFLNRKHQKTQVSLLKRKNRDITQAFNWASHEIRGPLNALTGYVEINRMACVVCESAEGDNVVQFDRDDFLERTRNARVTCLSLKHIADDVINIGTLGGSVTLHSKRWTVRELVETVLPFFEAKAAERSLRFHFVCDPSMDTVLRTDRTRVIQVLHNLVGNAFKYTLEGDVWLTVTRKPSSISFQVEDTGVGIDPSLADKLFQADGIQLHNQADRIKARSSGLGLHFCKLLCEKLGASIRYEPASEHQGSVFTFELPL